MKVTILYECVARVFYSLSSFVICSFTFMSNEGCYILSRNFLSTFSVLKISENKSIFKNKECKKVVTQK